MLEHYIRANLNKSAPLLFYISVHLLQSFTSFQLNDMACQQSLPLEINIKPNSIHFWPYGIISSETMDVFYPCIYRTGFAFSIFWWPFGQIYVWLCWGTCLTKGKFIFSHNLGGLSAIVPLTKRILNHQLLQKLPKLLLPELCYNEPGNQWQGIGIPKCQLHGLT